MPVPYTFGSATASIPLSQLDSNFATAITIGNTAVQLGNTVTTLNNMTLANVTISSGNVTITNVSVTTANVSGTANVQTLAVTQNATVAGNVTVTGNVSMNVATITTSNVTTENVSSLIVTGNQTFVGTGNRITGDFSNATQANKVTFQTSTTNGATVVGAIPNGTNVISQLRAYNASDPDNAAWFGFVVNGTQAQLSSNITGTGTYLPMLFLTGGSERMRLDTSGNLGIGTSSPGARLNVTDSQNTGTGLVVNNPNTGASAYSFIKAASNDGNIWIVNGSTANGGNPLIYSDNATGVFTLKTFNALPLTFGTSNTERMRIDTSGNVGIGQSSITQAFANYTQLNISGSSGATIQMQSGATNRTNIVADANGLYIASLSGYTVFSNGGTGTGTERMRIDSSGNVGINTTTTTRARLNIDTDGTNTSAGYGLALTNTAGGGATWTLQCGDQGVNNGAFTIRQTGISGTTYFKIEASTGYITVPGVYTLTTASAANVFVGTGGDLRRSTSSLKYKTDVQDATYGLAEVMVLRPVTYKGKNDGDTIFGGLIAEEVDAVGLTEFVQYADDGTPDALAYGNMVSLCIKAIQEQQALITALTARITALESK